jgi:hypothetical protein
MRVKRRDPFSLVRLGDGEATMIKYPRYTNEAAARSQVERWWKVPRVDGTTMQTIGGMIAVACRDADMLGIPSEGEQLKYPKWNSNGLRFHQFMETYGFASSAQDYFYFYHIINLQKMGVLKQALEAAHITHICCITCRKVELQLFKALGVRTIKMFFIPAETFRWRRYGQIDVAAKAVADVAPHWPTRFNQVRPWIQLQGPGQVFLIGAGGLGKVYCQWAKAAGSMGIDVGALFDGWAGLPTRPYLQGVMK